MGFDDIQDIFKAELAQRLNQNLTKNQKQILDRLSKSDKADLDSISTEDVQKLVRISKKKFYDAYLRVLSNNARRFALQGKEVPVEEPELAEPKPAVSTAAIKANGNKKTFSFNKVHLVVYQG